MVYVADILEDSVQHNMYCLEVRNYYILIDRRNTYLSATIS